MQIAFICATNTENGRVAPLKALGGTCHQACFDLCDQHKKLASGFALDRTMPRCKLFVGFIMICATNTENWRVAMCEASLAIYSSFGLRPLGALSYELCDQRRKLACPRYILDLDGNGLIGSVLCGRPTQKAGRELRSISQCAPAYRERCAAARSHRYLFFVWATNYKSWRLKEKVDSSSLFVHTI